MDLGVYSPRKPIRPIFGPLPRALWYRLGFGLLLLMMGCGTTREHRATDQLLLSDAVDRSVSHLDFRPFTGEKVFLDTRFLQQQPTDPNLVNANYVISSIRQQMFHHGCLVQEKEETADYVIEARLGTLGSDGHEVNFGIPASNALGAAATAISSVPAIPAIPEISLARRSASSAAAKVGLFAYRRATKEPVWQSGLSIGRSDASGRWIFGIGPFQSGTIYDGTLFAGGHVNSHPKGPKDPIEAEKSQEKSYRNTAMFDERLYRKLVELESATPEPPSPQAAGAPQVELASHATAVERNQATTDTQPSSNRAEPQP